MGYNNSDSITVDAILTKKGRQKLALGQALGVTKYTFSDDGVDYNLYNVNHPSGSNYYGEAIENLPLLEAVPDNSVMNRYELYTGERLQTLMPTIKVTATTVNLTHRAHTVTIAPQTDNFPGTEKFRFKFTDTLPLHVEGFESMIDHSGVVGDYPIEQGITSPKEYIGSQLVLAPKETSVDREVTFTIIGHTSGAILDMKVTIDKNMPTV
jgi:hypothetical protein